MHYRVDGCPRKHKLKNFCYNVQNKIDKFIFISRLREVQFFANKKICISSKWIIESHSERFAGGMHLWEMSECETSSYEYENNSKFTRNDTFYVNIIKDFAHDGTNGGISSSRATIHQFWVLYVHYPHEQNWSRCSSWESCRGIFEKISSKMPEANNIGRN